MKRFFWLFFLFIPFLGLAQNEADVLRYSQTHFGGTARYVGLSGAFGALGADISTLSSNPAGIAMFRKSELTFSPGFAVNTARADYLGTTDKDTKLNLNIGNIGYVGTMEIKGSKNWISGHLGIAYNRLANFHSNILIEGKQMQSSFLEEFTNNARGLHPVDLENSTPFSSHHAYQTFLIDPMPQDSTRYTHKVYDSKVDQEKTIARTGSVGETTFSFGADYKNKLYLGATIGIPNITYEENSTISETTLDSAKLDTFHGGLKKYQFTETLETNGNGLNVKIGAIYRPADWIRMGLSIHSSSILSMTDNWTASAKSQFHDDTTYSTDPTIGEYDYRILTPFRAQGSLAFILSKRGLISVDYEYVDYTQGKLKLSRSNEGHAPFTQSNQDVQNKFVAASNLRIGTEWRFPPFTIRGGFAQYENPYKSGFVTHSEPTRTYSIGLGYREKSFYVDGAFSLTKWPEDHYPYDPSLAQVAKIENSLARIIGTVGFRF